MWCCPDAEQQAHTVPIGVGAKSSGVGTDLLILLRRGNALSPSLSVPGHRESGTAAHVSSWGGTMGAKPELEVGMAKSGGGRAGLGCCSTVPL